MTTAKRRQDSVLYPVHVATSKPAQKAYLGTFLFITTIFSLLIISTLAYTLFYYYYVPQTSIERVIHLQFGNGAPYGSAHFSSALTSFQPYDISISLHLPRNPSNLEIGNFMLDASLLAPINSASSATSYIPSAVSGKNISVAVLAHSRRSAILTWTSPVIETAHKALIIPWLITGWSKEAETLEIPLFEGVMFERGRSNIPDSIRVAIEEADGLRVYGCSVMVRAKFEGLRWIVYNHRIMSYAFFVATFFFVAVASMIFTYVGIWIYSAKLRKREEEPREIKQEPDEEIGNKPLSMDDLSDTARNFPTLSRQVPLSFAPRKSRIEGAEESIIQQEEIERTAGIQPLIGEADDEDEEDDFGDQLGSWRDSGIGTSVDDEGKQRLQRRKRGSAVASGI